MPYRSCTNYNRLGHFAKDCRAGLRMVNPLNVRNPTAARGACFECGGTDNYKAACPILNRAQRPGGNRPEQEMAIERGQGRGNNENLARERAFVMGAEEARQDPNIVIGTFTLNNHYATTLFDFGADNSFISTTFIPLHKAEIVCHEKVVRIPLPNGKILRVLGERPEEKFLGHVVNEDDIHVDPSKIKAVKNWEAPKSPTEHKKYVWGDEQERAFQILKDKLCNAPVPALPDGPEDFVVYCDASCQGMGYVLMQRGKVIAYAYKQLKIHEKNYTTHDLELGTLVFTLKIWRHYLYWTKSVIYTDHKSLQHIFNQKELNMHQRH
ncbi:putative reverse transcriptase domain-containing protein [Tanacetum coccineum]